MSVEDFTLLTDSASQYFALTLLLCLISLQQLFSTLTTKHKSISLCVIVPENVFEDPRGCVAVPEPVHEHRLE